jgi:hypothetical protein
MKALPGYSPGRAFTHVRSPTVLGRVAPLPSIKSPHGISEQKKASPEAGPVCPYRLLLSDPCRSHSTHLGRPGICYHTAVNRQAFATCVWRINVLGRSEISPRMGHLLRINRMPRSWPAQLPATLTRGACYLAPSPPVPGLLAFSTPLPARTAARRPAEPQCDPVAASAWRACQRRAGALRVPRDGR